MGTLTLRGGSFSATTGVGGNGIGVFPIGGEVTLVGVAAGGGTDAVAVGGARCFGSYDSGTRASLPETC